MTIEKPKISLYKQANAGFYSLITQTARVSLGLTAMLMLTGGSPPGWLVSASFFVGVGFVAWSENKRQSELEIQVDKLSDVFSSLSDVFSSLSDISWRRRHFSTLRTKITDAEILMNSLRNLGIEVKTDADVRGYNGQRIRCDIVAVLEGKYDLGWSRNSDGSYDLIADLQGVAKKHNETELVNSINQKYAVNKTLAEVKKRGLQNINVKDGNLTGDRYIKVGGDYRESHVSDKVNRTINAEIDSEQIGNYGIGHMSGGEIQKGAKVAGVINEAEQQNLAKAAGDIQQLLEQLSQTYPTTTTTEQMLVATKAIERIESDQTWKQRAVNALKQGSLSTLETNPVGAFVVVAIKGWQNSE